MKSQFKFVLYIEGKGMDVKNFYFYARQRKRMV